MVVRRCLAFLCLLTLVFVAFAEDKNVEVPRKMVVFFRTTGPFTENEKLILPETFLILLSYNKDITIIEPFITEWAEKDDSLTAATAEKGGDCWTKISVAASNANIKITGTSFDIENKKYIFKDKVSTGDRKLRDLQRGFFRDFLTEISLNYNSRPAVVKIVEVEKVVLEEVIEYSQKGVPLKITALPETEILGLKKNEIVRVNQDGTTDVEIEQFVTCRISAYREGFYPVTKTFFVGEEGMEIKLEQRPASLFAADLYTNNGSYLGAAFSYFPVPNYLFLQVALTSFMFRWMPNTSSQAPTPINYVYLNFGYYIGREDWFVRFYLTHGILFRLTFIQDFGFRPDPLSAWGLNLANLNAEFSLTDNLKMTAGWGLKLFFTNFIDQFRSVVSYANRGSFGYAFFTSTVLDASEISLGLRYLF